MIMRFTYQQTINEKERIYKTLYIKKTLVQKIQRIAEHNKVSWNKLVINMIEYCLDDQQT